MNRSIFALALSSTAVCAGLVLGAGPGGGPVQPGVFPPNTSPYGESYTETSVRWWQWLLAHPVEGHPAVDAPEFDVDSGQSGQVWFLAAPVGTAVREITIPPGKALFVAVINSEWSSLEGYATEEEQRALAVDFADHMRDVFCTVNDVSVADMDDYRFESPQFTFTAPSPWLFGETGGTGEAVSDGYYIFLEPLSAGTHELHFGGRVHYSEAEGDPFTFDAAIDMTYIITVQR